MVDVQKVLKMEADIDQIKALSDLLMSVGSCEDLPESFSIFITAGIIYDSIERIKEIYSEICKDLPKQLTERIAV